MSPLSLALNKSWAIQADDAHVIEALVQVKLADKHVRSSSVLLVTVRNSDSAIQRGLIHFTFANVEGIVICIMSSRLLSELL